MRRFTLEGLKSAPFDPYGEAKGAVLLGAEKFVKAITREKVPRKPDGSVSHLVELHKPPAEVRESMMTRVSGLTTDGNLRGKLLVYGLRRSTAYSLKEVAKLTGAPSAVAVSQTVSRLNAGRRKDAVLNGLMTKLERMCRGSA